MDVDAMTDTSTVRFEVRGIERVHGGRVVALAIIAIDIEGVELVLQGVQIMREPNGGWMVRAPVWRHPKNGKWVPSIILPDELWQAIGAELLAKVTSQNVT